MRVLFFMGFHEYPVGPAATKRAQMLARGLESTGAEVRFLSRPQHGQPGAGQGWLVDRYGLHFQLVSYRTRSWLGKLVMLARLPGEYRRAAARILDEMPYDAVIGFGHTCLFFSHVRWLCRRRGIVYVQDFNEWFTISPKELVNPFFWDAALSRRYVMPGLGGVIAISRLFKSHADAVGAPAILLPSMAEAEIPPAIPPAPPGRPFTVTYLGPLSGRDMPRTMLEGLRLAVRQGHDMRMVVVGDVDSQPVGRRARAMVSADAELKDRVTFTGYVPADEVKRRLAASDAFLLVRPDRWEARACFPTRLQEYLETARPVVMSDVGDVGSYFKHRHDAWLIAPGHRPGALAEALIYLKTHPDEARAIGLAGQETSVREFSLLLHGRRLRQFLEDRQINRPRQP